MATLIKAGYNKIINLDNVTNIELDGDGDLRFYFNFIVDGWPACLIVRKDEARGVLDFLRTGAGVLNRQPDEILLTGPGNYAEEPGPPYSEEDETGPGYYETDGPPPKDRPEPYVADEPEPMYF